MLMRIAGAGAKLGAVFNSLVLIISCVSPTHLDQCIHHRFCTFNDLHKCIHGQRSFVGFFFFLLFFLFFFFFFFFFFMSNVLMVINLIGLISLYSCCRYLILPFDMHLLLCICVLKPDYEINFDFD